MEKKKTAQGRLQLVKNEWTAKRVVTKIGFFALGNIL
jgi:hypothetical protein